MDSSDKLRSALNDFRTATGLNIDLQPESEQDALEAAEQLRRLTSAFRTRYDREAFFLSLLTGSEATPRQVQNSAARFHLDPNMPRALFLIEGQKTLEETVYQVLREFLAEIPDVILVPVSDFSLAIVCGIPEDAPEDELEEKLYEAGCSILDLLGAEAMISVKVSLTGAAAPMSGLAGLFRRTQQVMKIGNMFLPTESVYSDRRLGVGRLIYHSAPEISEGFLSEVFGKNSPDEMTEDLIATARCFFKNDLIITAAAKELHMHRNTLIYRLEQIRRLTGLDIRHFQDAMQLELAIDTLYYLRAQSS